MTCDVDDQGTTSLPAAQMQERCVMSADLSRIPVLRVALAMGPTGLARAAAFMFLGLALVVVLFVWRSDLTRPGDIGMDASNYYAAGLRLADGGQLYALVAGDRPVPADFPPFWSVPILSPPPIAVAWMLPALLLPGAVAMYGWWLVGMLGAMGTALHAARARTAQALLVVIVLSPAIALTAVSGNVNAWLIPAYAVTFALARSGAGRRATLALALIAGSAAAFKLAPILLIWWLFIRGQRRAALGAVGVVALWVVASVMAAGSGSFAEYLEISRGTALSGATPLSATGMALALGVPAGLATLAPLASLMIAALGAVLLRARPSAAAFVLALGTVYATPVVRFESLALLVAAIAGNVRFGPVELLGRVARPRRGAAAALVASVCLLALWIWTAPRSSLLIENQTETPIIVRFGVDPAAPSGYRVATFGYRVEPGASARGFGALPGGLTGTVTVFRPDCSEVARGTPPTTGGLLVVSPKTGIEFVADREKSVPDAPYVADCAGP
jgi:hypothetical protein